MARLSLKPASALLLAALLLASAAADAPPITAESESPKKCSLSGTWVNDLGSTMTISAPDADAGAFSGSYRTAVTSSNEAIVESPLHGAQHHQEQRAQPTFAFTVRWKFTTSTTAFVGQCFVDETGAETLETLWLLRKEVPTRDKDWQATLVGKNTFTRIQ